MLQVADLPAGLLQGGAEPHLGPQQLQHVADHVVHVDGERVVLGPHVQALLPPDVALYIHTHTRSDERMGLLMNAVFGARSWQCTFGAKVIVNLTEVIVSEEDQIIKMKK